jgi:hypothetical protein
VIVLHVVQGKTDRSMQSCPQPAADHNQEEVTVQYSLDDGSWLRMRREW